MRTPILLLVGLVTPFQDPASKPDGFATLAQQCAGGGLPASEALQRLPVEIAADYAGAYAAWRALPEGKPRTILGSLLQLELLGEAEVVVSGVLAQVEADQGGVIDHHTVRLTFGQGLAVHRAPAAIARELMHDRTFAVLRGTSRDTWLASVLVRQLRATTGAHTFAFVKRSLQHAGAPIGGGLQFHEVHLLHAAAGRVAGGMPR